jgi:hypothetical protein
MIKRPNETLPIRKSMKDFNKNLETSKIEIMARIETRFIRHLRGQETK